MLMVSALARAETVDQDLFAFVLDLALNVEQSVNPHFSLLKPQVLILDNSLY